MQLSITLEHRFLKTPDGQVWTVTQCPYGFFSEYLEVFDSIRVIARAFPVAKAEPHFLKVEGPGVEFYPIPGYKGPFEFVASYRQVRQQARNAVPRDSATILRVHSQVANSVEDWLSSRQAPFALEVVADPYDVLSPAANRHPAAPIARRYFTSRLQSQCRRAVAVSYVTRDYLQNRYPPSGPETGQYASAVSDVNLSDECFREPRQFGEGPKTPHAIVFVGTLESLYKGPDVLIDAVALCKARGVDLRVRFLGSGQQSETLRARCLRLGVESEIEFVGNVTAGAPVRGELDAADLFVLPSRAEGVPRAMLEAMARGLPCVGSTIGGIPELLAKQDLVPPNDAPALAAKLTEVVSAQGRLQAMSDRNLATARNYSAAGLSLRRRQFYEAVKERSRVPASAVN